MFVENHLNSVISNITIYKSENFRQACKLLETCHKNGNWVFLGGNGGSQTIAEHFAIDWTKGVREITGTTLKSIVLNASSGTLTAISNDLSYRESLAFNLSGLARSQDLLVLISSSGKSPNILRALEVATEIGMKSILISGFGPKELNHYPTVELNVDSEDYQVIEDVHSIFGHLILKFFRQKSFQ